MYNINNKSEKFYVFISSKNQHIYIGNEEQLINYLVNHFYKSWNELKNSCFDDINVTGKDTKFFYKEEKIITIDEFEEKHISYEKQKIIIPKEYLFYDGNNRIIDVRVYAKKALKQYEHKSQKSYYTITRKDNKITNETYISYRSWRGNTVCYKYRRGPVPGTGKLRYNYRKSFRFPKINSIRKQVSNLEEKDYIRKKSIPNLYGWWDDNPSRNVEKSWKRQSKCRHQWQKNLKGNT
jgi:hypothetical protein